MILYEGPSQIDGAPIVALAVATSKNAKTGDMVQVFILRSDVAPLDAVRKGLDRSICGDCPQRWYLGGACYVTVFQAPASVYRAYKRGNYSGDLARARVAKALAAGKPVRFGAYGDPAAVPLSVWDSFLTPQMQHGWTGYTHQWKRNDVQEYRRFLMASCDTVEEANQAAAKGWRVFLVTKPGESKPVRFVECLSDARGMSCAECRICDGTKGKDETQRASVWIEVHGARQKRFRLNVVR